MSPEKWERVEAVFKDALALSPSKRQQFVERACSDDSDIRIEVATLLASYDQAGSFLEAPALPQTSLDEVVSGLTFLPEQIVAERFKIVRFIAEGGMGEVYEALDQELRERVALKTIRRTMASDEETETRFMREIQLARRVTHPNVCRIYDVFHHKVQSGNFEDEVRFLTMELLAGETLGARARRLGTLSVERVVPIAEQIAAALSAAHDAGIVHRDLKPDNVMLVSSKKGLRAVVTDFGLARAEAQTASEPLAAMATSREDLLWALHGAQAGASFEEGPLRRLARRARRHMAAFGLAAAPAGPITDQGRVMGTPDYMSPEQAQGAEADERSDIWSFGVVLFELLAGRLPYRRESSFTRWLRRVVERRPTPGRLPKVPRYLRGVVERCLELERSDRYASFDEILDELRRGRSRVREGGERRSRARAAVIAGVLGAAAAAVYVLTRV